MTGQRSVSLMLDVSMTDLCEARRMRYTMAPRHPGSGHGIQAGWPRAAWLPGGAAHCAGAESGTLLRRAQVCPADTLKRRCP